MAWGDSKAFIIAKVIPHGGTQPVYRCLGGWEMRRQDYDDVHIPVRASRRFLTSIRQPDNAEIVAEELYSISGKYGPHTSIEPTVPDTPCPYSIFLLASSCALGPHALPSGAPHCDGSPFPGAIIAAHARVSLEAHDDRYRNLEDTIVFDITDLKNPTYCFLRRSPNVESPPIVTGTGIYDPDYDEMMRGPYPDHPKYEKARDIYESMKHETVTSHPTLEEAWPNTFKGTTLPDADFRQDSAVYRVPSLVGLTLEVGLKKAIATGNIAALDPLLMNREHHSALYAALQTYDPLPYGAVQLVMDLVGWTPDVINLSHLQLLPKYLMRVLSKYRDHKLRSLNISHNRHVTKDVLCTLLEAHPHTRRIVLFGTAITDQDMDNLITENPHLFSDIQQLIHPAYLTYEARSSYPRAFTFDGSDRFRSIRFKLPYFNPTVILHMLTEFLLIYMDDIEYSPIHMPMIYSAESAFMAIFSRFSGNNAKWDERSICFIPSTHDVGHIGQTNARWTFIVRTDPTIELSSLNMNLRYSFMRLNSSGDRDNHDLESFVSALESEGMTLDADVVSKARDTFLEAASVVNMRAMDWV